MYRIMGTQAEKLKAILYCVRTGILCYGKIYFQRLIGETRIGVRKCQTLGRSFVIYNVH